MCSLFSVALHPLQAPKPGRPRNENRPNLLTRREVPVEGLGPTRVPDVATFAEIKGCYSVPFPGQTKQDLSRWRDADAMPSVLAPLWSVKGIWPVRLDDVCREPAGNILCLDYVSRGILKRLLRVGAHLSGP